MTRLTTVNIFLVYVPETNAAETAPDSIARFLCLAKIPIGRRIKDMY